MIRQIIQVLSNKFSPSSFFMRFGLFKLKRSIVMLQNKYKLPARKLLIRSVGTNFSLELNYLSWKKYTFRFDSFWFGYVFEIFFRFNGFRWSERVQFELRKFVERCENMIRKLMLFMWEHKLFTIDRFS